MSVSTSPDALPVEHALVQATDDRGRTGSLHAAIPAETGWRTACGTDLDAGPRVNAWWRATAWRILVLPGARVCRRCERVGTGLS